jgi:hypothetical protein
MADALASGASIRKDVGVQVPPRPPKDPSSAGASWDPLFYRSSTGANPEYGHRDTPGAPSDRLCNSGDMPSDRLTPNLLPDYTDKVAAAVRSNWHVREAQAAKSRDAGMLNTGLRAEVTVGRRLDALELLLVNVLVDTGMPPSMLEVKRRPVPGYFRRDKSWDAAVTVEGRVLANMESKSIVGDNPGQNFNNRTDEALGQAMDIWKAVERGIIASPLRPRLGYFISIEDNAAWNAVSGRASSSDQRAVSAA